MATILCASTLLISLAEAQESKRNEVDGVDIGDKLEDVINNWNLSDSDVTIMRGGSGQFGMSSSSSTKLLIDQSRRQEASAAWLEVAPQRSRIEKVKKGNTVYEAFFDFNGRASGRILVTKTFNNNFDVKPIYEKVKAKYGVENLSGVNVDEIYSKYSHEDWERVRSKFSVDFGTYEGDNSSITVNANPQQGILHFDVKEGSESSARTSAEIDKLTDELVKMVNEKYPPVKTNIDDVQF